MRNRVLVTIAFGVAGLALSQAYAVDSDDIDAENISAAANQLFDYQYHLPLRFKDSKDQALYEKGRALLQREDSCVLGATIDCHLSPEDVSTIARSLPLIREMAEFRGKYGNLISARKRSLESSLWSSRLRIILGQDEGEARKIREDHPIEDFLSRFISALQPDGLSYLQYDYSRRTLELQDARRNQRTYGDQVKELESEFDASPIQNPAPRRTDLVPAADGR